MARIVVAGRWPAYLLIGLGTLLLTVAVLIPAYSVRKLTKTPLDLEITTVAQTPDKAGGEVLEQRSLTAPTGSVKVETGVPLIQQTFITAEDPATSREVTLQAGQTLRRTDKQGDTGLLTAVVDRVTVNRKSGEPVGDPVGSIQTQSDKPADQVDRVGLQYRFPFKTQRTTYSYFDAVARDSFDLTFSEATELNDLPVLHFTQKIPAIDLSRVVSVPLNRLSLPAEKWGVAGGRQTVTMNRYYSTERELWVEPRTGTIVKEQEQPYIYYGPGADKPTVTVLKAKLVYDENTVEDRISAAKSALDRISLYGRLLPLGLGVAGVISLAAGVVVTLRTRRTLPE